MIPRFAGKKQKYFDKRSNDWEPKSPKPRRFNPGDIVAPIGQRRKPFSEWKLLRVLTCEPSHISGDEVNWHFTYDPLIKDPETEHTMGFDYVEKYFKLNTEQRKKAMSIHGGYVVGKETGIL